MQKGQVWSLDREDHLEKGMATHSSILAWRIPWTEAPGGLQFIGLQRVRQDWATNTLMFFHLSKYKNDTSCHGWSESASYHNQNFETQLRFFIAGYRLKAALVSNLLPSGELRSCHAEVSSAFRTAVLVYKPGCENPPPPPITKKGLSSTQYLWFKRHGLCI